MLHIGHLFPKKIKVAYVNSGLFTVLESPTGELVPGSLEGQLLILVSQAIGFKYKLVPATDGQWGSKTSDGNWSGVVGLVNRSEADIAVNLLSITSDRMDAVDFSIPYTETGLTFLTNLPELLPRKYLFLYPFSSSTWTCVLVTLFVLAFVMSKLQDAKWFVFDSFWMIYTNMVRQPVCKKELKYRFFVGFSWLVISVISMSYAAVILSFLTVPLLEKPLRNFEDLYKALLRGEYAVLSLRGDSAVELLSGSKSDYLRSMARMIQENEWYIDLPTMFQRFGREEFGGRRQAVLGPRFPYGSFFGRAPASSKHIAEDDATTDRIAFAVNKNFCCIDVLNSAIRRIRQSGIYGKFQSKIEYEAWIKRSNQTADPLEHRLTMEDLSGAIFVLLFGYAVSLTVFLCEVGINFGKKKGYFEQFKFI